jgi:hypothetical protein
MIDLKQRRRREAWSTEVDESSERHGKKDDEETKLLKPTSSCEIIRHKHNGSVGSVRFFSVGASVTTYVNIGENGILRGDDRG